MELWEKRANSWKNQEALDPTLKSELDQMSDDELEDAFGQELEFGTAGLRGIIGVGTNRMNRYIVRQTTEGLARWIVSQGEEAKKRGVAISHDNRHFSDEFALEAACVLGNHGIKVYLFDQLHPTPVLAFAVRHLNAYAGIMVTASHNPPNYNGYKVYGEDGGQFPPKAADELTEIIRQIQSPFDVEIGVAAELTESGLLEYVGQSVVDDYMEALKTVIVDPSVAAEHGDLLKVVFSGMHGTAAIVVDQVFETAGFSNVVKVEEQMVVDPNFSTVESPNPEAEPAFDLSKEYGARENADLLLATDPDADRLGVMVRDDEGTYHLLSGNQVASLMFHYIADRKSEQGELPENAALIRSIVSTPFVDEIAKDYGIDVFQVLTGFKFVGDQIKEFEKTDSHEFVMGFEEAIGYLIRPYVRDKDSLQAITLICELATYYKLQDKTLLDALNDLYEKYGHYHEHTISVQYPGLEGKARMEEIMANVRENPMSEVAGLEVIRVEDFLEGTCTEKDGTVTEIDQDRSNVLRYTFSDKSWIALRPSGTEPKIKLYMGAVSDTLEDAQRKLADMEATMRAKVE